MLSNNAYEYGTISKALHWIMAVMIIALIGVGLYMTGLDKEDTARRALFNQHKAVGATVLLLAIIRIVWIRISPAPALPAVFAQKEQRVVKGIQSLLYLLLILMPVSGYVMSTAAGYPVNLFGLFELPLLFGKSKELAEMAEMAHHFMGLATIALIVLHLAGAAKHRIKDRDGERDILKRML